MVLCQELNLFKLRKVDTQLFSVIVCSTLNMSQRRDRRELFEEREERRELFEDIRKQTIDQLVKGKNYKKTSNQFYVPVITVSNIIKQFKVHGSVANRTGSGK